MLRPDPAQQHRLEEIITNLHARLDEAHTHGWHGAIEGLETSLAAANQKLTSMRRSRPSTDLGMPAVPKDRRAWGPGAAEDNGQGSQRRAGQEAHQDARARPIDRQPGPVQLGPRVRPRGTRAGEAEVEEQWNSG